MERQRKRQRDGKTGTKNMKKKWKKNPQKIYTT